MLNKKQIKFLKAYRQELYKRPETTDVLEEIVNVEEEIFALTTKSEQWEILSKIYSRLSNSKTSKQQFFRS